MIDIHYRSIAHLLSLNSDDSLKTYDQIERKQKLHAYRQQVLEHFCPNLEIRANVHGKPIAINWHKGEFNQSHSQNNYVLAYSTQVQDLGVDLEDLNRSVKMQALAKRSFHPLEYAIWQQLEYCREYWFKVWTIKEAVLKAHGLGIRLDLKSINTQAHPTWSFGRVEHPVLGSFDYQNFIMSDSMLTVAYRAMHMKIPAVFFH